MILNIILLCLYWTETVTKSIILLLLWRELTFITDCLNVLYKEIASYCEDIKKKRKACMPKHKFSTSQLYMWCFVCVHVYVFVDSCLATKVFIGNLLATGRWWAIRDKVGQWGQLSTNQLHDINWGALNHASCAPQSMSCNCYVCVCAMNRCYTTLIGMHKMHGYI